MNIKLPTLIICLLFGFSVYGQNLSLYTETKSLNVEKLDSQEDGLANFQMLNTLESFNITQSLGALYIKKEITYFGEITISGRESTLFSRPLYSHDEKIQESPFHINYSGKVGLGKSFLISKNLEYHLLGFLGYGYRKSGNLYVKSWDLDDVHYLESDKSYIFPYYHDISLGVKIFVDYRILKVWSLGLSFEHTLEFSYSNNERYSHSIYYSNLGEIKEEKEIIHQLKDTAFNSSFFNLGIYIRYTFKK